MEGIANFVLIGVLSTFDTAGVSRTHRGSHVEQFPVSSSRVIL
jgi:hypothetical protein